MSTKTTLTMIATAVAAGVLIQIAFAPFGGYPGWIAIGVLAIAGVTLAFVLQRKRSKS